MKIVEGICSFCGEEAKVVQKDPNNLESPAICKDCITLGLFSIRPQPKGSLCCPKCKSINDFTIKYENGVELEFKRAGVDSKGYTIYFPVRTTKDWALHMTKKTVSCVRCNTQVPEILWKYCKYI